MRMQDQIQKYSTSGGGGTNDHTLLLNLNAGATGTGGHTLIAQRISTNRAPTINDDDSNTGGLGRNILVPAFWVDTTTDIVYVCTDASTGAAVWTNIPTTSLQLSIRHTLAYDSVASFNIGDAVPDNARIYKVVVNVETAFNGSSESTLTVGDAGDPDRLAELTDINLHAVGTYVIDNYYRYVSSTQITGAYTQDSATQGNAYIEIFYTTA